MHKGDRNIIIWVVLTIVIFLTTVTVIVLTGLNTSLGTLGTVLIFTILFVMSARISYHLMLK